MTVGGVLEQGRKSNWQGPGAAWDSTRESGESDAGTVRTETLPLGLGLRK